MDATASFTMWPPKAVQPDHMASRFCFLHGDRDRHGGRPHGSLESPPGQRYHRQPHGPLGCIMKATWGRGMADHAGRS